MNKKTLTRRQFLKAALVSSSAITTASLLPGKWLKPEVKTKNLPAHAQVSTPQGVAEN